MSLALLTLQEPKPWLNSRVHTETFDPFTSAQRLSLTGNTGQIVYDTTESAFYYWANGEWYQMEATANTGETSGPAFFSGQLLAPVTIPSSATAGISNLITPFTGGSSAQGIFFNTGDSALEFSSSMNVFINLQAQWADATGSTLIDLTFFITKNASPNTPSAILSQYHGSFANNTANVILQDTITCSTLTHVNPGDKIYFYCLQDATHNISVGPLDSSGSHCYLQAYKVG